MMIAADYFVGYLQTLAMLLLPALTFQCRYRGVPTLLYSSIAVACVGRLLAIVVPEQMPLRFVAMLVMQFTFVLMLYHGRTSTKVFVVLVQFLLSAMAELTSTIYFFMVVPDVDVTSMTTTPHLVIARTLYLVLLLVFESFFLMYFHRAKLHLDKKTVLLFLPFPVSVTILELGIYATGAKALAGRTIIPMMIGVSLSIIGSVLVFWLLNRMAQKVRLEEKLALMQNMQQMEQSYHRLLEQSARELTLLRQDFRAKLDEARRLAEQYHGNGQAVIRDILEQMYSTLESLALPAPAHEVQPPVQSVSAKPDKIRTLLFWVFPISQIILVAVMIVLGSDSINIRNLMFLIASVTFTVLGGISLFKLTQGVIEKSNLEDQLAAMQRVQQLELEYYELIQQRVWQGSVIRHDFKDRLATVYGIMQQHHPEGDSSVQAVLEDINHSMHEASPVIVCQNRIVDTIVNVKRQEAGKLGIDMDVNLHIPKEIAIATIDLCSIFSNLLNNAIEACDRLPDTTSKPIITVRTQVRGGYLIIKVINPTIGEPLRKGGRLISTKADKQNHGLGMLLLESICQRYAGQMDADYADGMFTVSMTLELAPTPITA